MSNSETRFGIGYCSSGKHFADKITESLLNKNVPYIEINSVEKTFSNTEKKIEILNSIRGLELFIIQDVSNGNVPENIMDLKMYIDSARRADSGNINVIIPTLPYARQDRRKGREPLTGAMILRELEMLGTKRIITLDTHNLALENTLNKTHFENLSALKNITDHIRNKGYDISSVLSPDTGGTIRAEKYSNKLEVPLMVSYKKRNSETNEVEKIEIAGKIEGKNILIVDDMIDTGGTISNVIKIAKEKGANKIYVAASLPFFNGKCIDTFSTLYSEGSLDKVIGTNVVYHSDKVLKNEWFEQVPMESYFSKVISNIHNKQSLSDLLK